MKDTEPAVRLILERQAHYRAHIESYKAISQQTGLPVQQISNTVRRLVRAMRVEVQRGK